MLKRLVPPAEILSEWKVPLVGDPGVGKTTFITALTDPSYGFPCDTRAATVGLDAKPRDVTIDGKTITINLWDTAGQERFRCLTTGYFRHSAGLLVLFDVTDKKSFLNVRRWVQEARRACAPDTPLVVVGNKTDLARAVTQDEAEAMAEDLHAGYVEATMTKAGTAAAALDAIAARIYKAMLSGNLRKSDNSVTLAATASNPPASKCSC
eukprot:m.49603 g.49603  ORF g.49603 m.49603 type:complete len:209 (-) comp6139_c0_seq1:323-949(-)